MLLFITVRVSPGDSVGDSRRWLGRPNIQLVSLLGDVFLNRKVLLFLVSLAMSPLWTDLQYLGICGLRISKVNHLVQQLVTDYKVVPERFSLNGYLVEQILSPDTLLLDLLEVLGHHLLDLVQEAEQQRHVAVGAACGNNVDVAVLEKGKYDESKCSASKAVYRSVVSQRYFRFRIGSELFASPQFV